MGDSVQKNRREVWSQEALSALRRAVEAQPGGDSDVDWAEVGIRELKIHQSVSLASRHTLVYL